MIDCRRAIKMAQQYGYFQDSLETVKMARKFGYKNDRDNGYISFRHDTKCGGVRIYVYTSTGTVATCLDCPSKGYAQLFRRSTTLEDLKDIFCDPQTHTNRGYHRIGRSGTILDQGIVKITPDVHYRFKGEHTMDDFFGEVTKKGVDSISFGYNSFIILYSDGSTAWAGEIPIGLKNKLRGRQSVLNKPEIIALGPKSPFLGPQSPQTYFIQYTDGQQQWNELPRELEREIEENGGFVALISIGDLDEYYVRFQDGSECWNLPPVLSNLLDRRNGSRSRINPNLAEVTKLSWSGKESIVGFADGTWRWSSAHSSFHDDDVLNKEAREILNSCEEIYDFQMSCLGDFVLFYKK